MQPCLTNFEHRIDYSGPLKAVILDWAGTVLDFGSCAPVTAVEQAFSELDLPISREQSRAPMGKSKREHILAILEMPEVATLWQEIHGGKLDDLADRIFERFLPVQKQLLQDFASLIPGCNESIQACRDRGMKIGSSTGYTQELMDLLMPLAAAQGYAPDAMVCASDVPLGRPAPWMCLENARRLDIWPVQSIVKVDDTVVGIEAGLSAGMWTVGFAASGNLVGLDLASFEALEADDRDELVHTARLQLVEAGAHVVVDSIADLPLAIDAIEMALSAGSHA